MVKICSQCDREHYSRGLCKAHYEWLRRRGKLFAEFPRKTDLERYEEKVDRSQGTDACHPWTGSVDSNGYGFFRVGERMQRAHRWGYEASMGPIREDEVVRHACDNPPCQNLRHLTPGTAWDNIQDMIQRGRSPDRTGSLNGRAKLTEDAIRIIRTSNATGTELAAMYGVSPTMIYYVRSRKTWKHLP
jgi:hypothetical protein